jgi:hypothetical protein
MNKFKISEHVSGSSCTNLLNNLNQYTSYDYIGMRMRIELNYRLHAFKSGHAEMRRSGNHITYVFERDTCMTAQFWAERSSG